MSIRQLERPILVSVNMNKTKYTICLTWANNQVRTKYSLFSYREFFKLSNPCKKQSFQERCKYGILQKNCPKTLQKISVLGPLLRNVLYNSILELIRPRCYIRGALWWS